MFRFNGQKSRRRQRAAEERRLIASLPWWSEIFLPTEKIPLEERVQGLRRVKVVYARGPIEFAPRLRALRERYRGMRRCFVIGNVSSRRLPKLLAPRCLGYAPRGPLSGAGRSSLPNAD